MGIGGFASPGTPVAILITPANPSVTVGESEQFHASATFTNGTQSDVTNSVSWSSSVAATATIVSNTGNASAKAVGTTSVTATLGGVTGQTTLTVTKAATGSTGIRSITVFPNSPPPYVTIGGSVKFISTATYSDGSTQSVTNSATWVSSNPAVAKIDSSGNTSTGGAGQTTGTAEISASYGGVTSNVVPLLVVAPQQVVVAITQPSTSTTQAVIGATIPFIAAISNDNGAGVQWEVNGVVGGNVTVGTILPTATQSGAEAVYTAPATVPAGATVTVTATSGADASAKASVTVTVLANSNARLAGQFVFSLSGEIPAANGTLPGRAVGIFQADGAGNISKAFVDSVAFPLDGGAPVAGTKAEYDGSYRLNADATGVITLKLKSDPAVQYSLAFTLAADGRSGYMVEASVTPTLAAPTDARFGSVSGGASSFQLQDASAHDANPGDVGGSYVFGLSAPGANGASSNSIGQLTLTATDAGHGTVTGEISGSDAQSQTLTGTYAIDADGSGHGIMNLITPGGEPLQLGFYATNSSLLYAVDLDQNATRSLGAGEIRAPKN
ncbi:MAG TPA: Ig-like domain-containing protein [Candidatus Acidoferrales bacterium]|nr:Ig-like domain-containing protein [Candidatus Acidoferrales bacterium]